MMMGKVSSMKERIRKVRFLDKVRKDNSEEEELGNSASNNSNGLGGSTNSATGNGNGVVVNVGVELKQTHGKGKDDFRKISIDSESMDEESHKMADEEEDEDGGQDQMRRQRRPDLSPQAGHTSELNQSDGFIRAKSDRRVRRTVSDPVGLTSNRFELFPPAGSPFQEALEKAHVTKNGKLKRMGRSTYEKKRKKMEITQEHEQYSITYCMMLGIRFSVSRQHPEHHHHDDNLHLNNNAHARESVSSSASRHLNVDDFMHVDRFDFPTPGTGNGTSSSASSAKGDHGKVTSTGSGGAGTPQQQQQDEEQQQQQHHHHHSTHPLPKKHLSIKFKFKDYAPEVFRKLRNKFGINDLDYMLSLCGKYNYIEFISNSKSGEFFFYSNDGHFLIKTQSKAESKFLRQILPQYYMYMSEHPDTMLVRICGMHRVRLAHMGRNMHFVIMQSVYSNAASLKIHTVYDLKGSTIGRQAKSGEAVFKDLDLIQNGQKFKLGPKRDAFMNQVRKDAEFLARLHIMDYSLLVGIHNKVAQTNPAKSIDALTGQSSRALGQQTSHRRLSGLETSPKWRSRGARSQTLPRSRRAIQMQFYKNHRYSKSEHNLNLDEDDNANPGMHMTVDQIRQELALLSPPSPVNIAKIKGPPSRFNTNLAEPGSPGFSSQKRLYECEDADEVFFDSDEEQSMEADRAKRSDSKFSPVDAMDENGNQGTEIYYFGIIDILQLYNTRKRAENAIKSLLEGGEQGISAVNPQKYAQRFVDFIDKHVE